VGVISLPKTVTRQRRDCDLNPGPSAPESSYEAWGTCSPSTANNFFLLRLGVIQSTTTISYSNTVRHLLATVIETSSFSRISQKAIVFVARRVCVLCYFICASRLISIFFVLFLPPNPGDAAEKSRIRRRKSRRSREYWRLPCFSAFAAI